MQKYQITMKDKSVQYLISRDKRLARVIEGIGDIECSTHDDPFEFIVGEIVGQMLSNSVADVITNRLISICGGKISLDSILQQDVANLREIGISNAKAQYILNFANAVNAGEIDFNVLSEMSDEDVMKTLMRVHGIGSWTSKMYLIFVLRREDVLPYEDGAFLQAYRWLYKSSDAKSEEIKRKCKKWKPYSSIAARYLYRALDMGMTKQEFHLFKKEQ